MLRPTRSVLWALLLAVFFSATLNAASITAASCQEPDVAFAVARAIDGDTVVLPSCSSGVSWTSELTVPVGITLQGQGVGSTVLVDNVPKGDSQCTGGAPMMSFIVSEKSILRITGFTIVGSSPDPYICQSGHVVISGTSSTVRVDHIEIDNQQSAGFLLLGCVYGLADHIITNAVHKDAFLILHYGCGGSSFGDYNFSQPTNLGSSDFWFIEDSTFNDPQQVGAGAFDGWDGMRVVFRHNTASFIVGHGTESSQRNRGMRAFEIYDNVFKATDNAQPFGFYVRSGTGVIWGNDFQDAGGNAFVGFIGVINDRDADAFPPWGSATGAPGACDGSSPWDNNSGTIYATGTATAAGTDILTDSSQSWTADQWVGSYAIRNLAQGWGSTIASNTANTITSRSSVFGQSRSWAVGDTYQVLSAYPCIDQVGRGQGRLLSGYVPTSTGWVNEALDPVYQWNNTHNGSGTITISSSSTRIVANRDYYDNQMKSGYTPYPYPHPFTHGFSQISLSPPTGVSAVAH